MDWKILLWIKLRNPLLHFEKYIPIAFWIFILFCVKLLENCLIVSWNLDYRCEESITCIFQHLFSLFVKHFWKYYWDAPSGAPACSPCFHIQNMFLNSFPTILRQFEAKFFDAKCQKATGQTPKNAKRNMESLLIVKNDLPVV